MLNEAHDVLHAAGKSFVAQALGVQACRQRYRVLFAKTSALLSDLAGGRADGSGQARLRRYLAPDPLILDDFALREYTVAQAEDLYELISRRYRRGALILTTNREPKDFYPLFPNPVLAEGLLDRLLNSAYLITMLPLLVPATALYWLIVGSHLAHDVRGKGLNPRVGARTGIGPPQSRTLSACSHGP